MTWFADRAEAGCKLADVLEAYRGRSVVYGLPRGGVAVAVEVARGLGAPLELIIARKIGHPCNPEYAVCAVTETGPLVCDEAERSRLDREWLQRAEVAARKEAKRRRQVYRPNRRTAHRTGEVAVVVDDGVATGLTMRAAVAELRGRWPGRIVVAVPCAPRQAVDDLYGLAEEVLVLTRPDEYLGAVGAYYDLFPQLTDEAVIDLLAARG